MKRLEQQPTPKLAPQRDSGLRQRLSRTAGIIGQSIKELLLGPLLPKSQGGHCDQEIEKLLLRFAPHWKRFSQGLWPPAFRAQSCGKENRSGQSGVRAPLRKCACSPVLTPHLCHCFTIQTVMGSTLGCTA